MARELLSNILACLTVTKTTKNASGLVVFEHGSIIIKFTDTNLIADHILTLFSYGL